MNLMFLELQQNNISLKLELEIFITNLNYYLLLWTMINEFFKITAQINLSCLYNFGIYNFLI